MTMHTPNIPDGVTYRIGSTTDSVTFELNDDGSMGIFTSEMIRLNPQQAFALMMFFRFPHVTALIEATNTRTQQQLWDEIHVDDEKMRILNAAKKGA